MASSPTGPARLDYHDPDFDDDAWPMVTVPGHWRSDPAFADTDGPVVYRTVFSDPGAFGPGHDDEAAGPRRTWLVLDGIFYTSDVWLDGTYLGDTEGYFFPHQLEITEQVDGPVRARAGRRGGLRAAVGPHAPSAA